MKPNSEGKTKTAPKKAARTVKKDTKAPVAADIPAETVVRKDAAAVKQETEAEPKRAARVTQETEAEPKHTGTNCRHLIVDEDCEPERWQPEEDIYEPVRPKRPKTEAGREKQMVALAVDLAEKQLREGTASAQVITHYLKLGTERERLEREIMREQKELISEKTKALKSMKQMEELYSEAIAAMKRYSGNDEP